MIPYDVRAARSYLKKKNSNKVSFEFEFLLGSILICANCVIHLPPVFIKSP